jgi:outer membrane protein TolC
VHALWLLIALLASGCSPDWYRRSADEEVQVLVDREREAVAGEKGPFQIAQAPLPLDAAGVAGEADDLTKTPPPVPLIAPIAPVPEDGPAPVGEPDKAEPPSRPEPAPEPPAPLRPEPQAGLEPRPKEEPRPPPASEGAAPSPPGAAAPPAGPAGAPPAPGVAIVREGVAIPKVPARVLTLADALRLALANNRDYQSQKEEIYLTALDLTFAQYQFAPRFFGVVTGDWSHDASGESGSIVSDFGLNLILVNGTRLSISLLNNFFQFFTGDRREVAETIVSGAVTQPLLRGFGTEIVREPLTQAERNLTYEIRSFERFRQTFSVDVISEFYRLLQERDRVANEYANWQSLVQSRDRVENLANAQVLPRFEVDQARQQELEAQDQWVSAVESYESALDRFKITLAVPIDEEIALDQAELEKLAAEPVDRLSLTVEAAIGLAMDLRYDLMTERDRVEDSQRRIEVVADQLEAQLDLRADAALVSGTGGDQKPLDFNTTNLAYGVGFDLDLPLDRKAERNAYAATLIAHERSRRDLTLLEDTIQLTVREAYRQVEREIVSYQILRASLALAEERVASTSLLLQAGRAETRDLLDSQFALNRARNSLTASLINYAIARLELFRDTGALRVSDTGQIASRLTGDDRNG